MNLYCDTDVNGPVASQTIYRKARKSHVCCERDKNIVVGETYEVYCGIWDGEPREYKTCEKCADLRDSHYALGYCPAFGELIVYHEEYVLERA